MLVNININININMLVNPNKKHVSLKIKMKLLNQFQNYCLYRLPSALAQGHSPDPPPFWPLMKDYQIFQNPVETYLDCDINTLQHITESLRAAQGELETLHARKMCRNISKLRQHTRPIEATVFCLIFCNVYSFINILLIVDFYVLCRFSLNFVPIFRLLVFDFIRPN